MEHFILSILAFLRKLIPDALWEIGQEWLEEWLSKKSGADSKSPIPPERVQETVAPPRGRYGDIWFWFVFPLLYVGAAYPDPHFDSLGKGVAVYSSILIWIWPALYLCEKRWVTWLVAKFYKNRNIPDVVETLFFLGIVPAAIVATLIYSM